MLRLKVSVIRLNPFWVLAFGLIFLGNLGGEFEQFISSSSPQNAQGANVQLQGLVNDSCKVLCSMDFVFISEKHGS